MYHRDEPGVCPLLGDLEIQERSKLVCLLKIELIEAAYPGKKNAILEITHIGKGLEHDGGVRRDLGFDGQRLQGNKALGQLVQCGRGLRLLAPLLQS